MVIPLVIPGSVARADGPFPIAGVTVAALLLTDHRANGASDTSPALLELGRAVTGADGRFAIQVEDEDMAAHWACALRHCPGFRIQFRCLDNDGAVLRDTEPAPWGNEVVAAIALAEPAFAVSREDWMALGTTMGAGKVSLLGELAQELCCLMPQGLFRGWSVARRLAVLDRLEQAVLDPEGVLERSGIAVRFAQLDDEDAIAALQERIRREGRGELQEAFELARERAQLLGGWQELHVRTNPERFVRGDYHGAVNEYIAGGVEPPAPGIIGYRDYLRDRWADSLRFEHRLGEGMVEIASAATMIERLNHRFHQDFATRKTQDQPANRVVAGILLKMLQAPDGTGYGFGRAPASIEGQGDRSLRDYCDYLISLTGLERAELENRYRIDLGRSDMEQSNPVQQNIDTLRRFLTDSYQSAEDPVAVKPDRKPGKDEKLIVAMPKEGAGPFFLEYEEWLAREEPFYPENYFDPRATYSWNIDDEARKAVNANSIPLEQFLQRPWAEKNQAWPRKLENVKGKWQVVRCHIDLYDLVMAAHNDFAQLNYTAAEEKYRRAKELAGAVRELFAQDWDYLSKRYTYWDYRPGTTASQQKKTDVGTVDKLGQYERSFHMVMSTRRVIYGATSSDIALGNTEISERWWGDRPDLFPGAGNKKGLAYLFDHLYFRVLPACLVDVLLAQGKFDAAVGQLAGRSEYSGGQLWWFPGPANFNIFAVDGDRGLWEMGVGGPLPYSSFSDRTVYTKWTDSTLFPRIPPTSVPTNRAELGYFKLKLGTAALDWADSLYRTNEPASIQRARELYKAVLFLHGEDPGITPHWGRGELYWPVPWMKSRRNPAVVSQVNRARMGFLQINANLNYYGSSSAHVPPLRYRVLKEAADRFAAGARGAQGDFLGYMQQLDRLTVDTMTAQAMVAKANAAIAIAQEQRKIAEFNVGQAQKQVDSVQAQIKAKRTEIAKADSFFQQVKDFASGMKDSVSKLGEMAFAGEEEAPPASSAQKLSTGDILKLGFKVGTASDVLGGATSTLAGAAGTAGVFGAFLYAGVSSMSSMAAAIAKRAGELAQLENVALPAAKALVELKQRDVTIAGLSQAIAEADARLGTDMLTYYAQRFLNRSFLVGMAEFSNRVMRRYLDLAGKTAWQAERALAYEQDRELAIVGFDYFPRNLRGVSGADQLQLHLAELDAARIQGLTQTIPVKQTVSLARDFPIEFGQLKKNGICRFSTSEEPLRIAYPGVYGYRVRNVTVSPAYAEPVQPPRGLISNDGVSVISRAGLDSSHTLVRYPDALPLSEFRMRNDMWVFALPDETLLPFEGSGYETVWELRMSKVGNLDGFDSMTDVLVTFDLRASYSAMLAAQHDAQVPASTVRTLLVSAKAMNPGALQKFHADGGKVTLAFDLARLADNMSEKQRKTLNFLLIAVGVDHPSFAASFASAAPAQQQAIAFEEGIAMSNAGALAAGNGGTPLPLNAFTALAVEQTFTLTIDAAANPTLDFKHLSDILLLAEYEATF